MNSSINHNEEVKEPVKLSLENLPIDVAVHHLLPHFKTKESFLNFRRVSKFSNQCVDKFFSVERKGNPNKKFAPDENYLENLNTATNEYILNLLESFIYALDANPLFASKMITEMQEPLQTKQLVEDKNTPVDFEERNTVIKNVVAVLCQNNFKRFDINYLRAVYTTPIDVSLPDISPRFISDFVLACMLLELANCLVLKTNDYITSYNVAVAYLNNRLVPNFINLQGIVLNGRIFDGNLVLRQHTFDLFKEKNLSNINFSCSQLSNYNFSGSNLSRCIFNEAVLKSLNLSKTNMRHAQLVNTSLYNVTFVKVDLSDANLCGMRVYEGAINWHTCILHNTQFINAAQCTAENIATLFHELAENLNITNLSSTNFAALEIAIARNLIAIVNNIGDRDKAIEVLNIALNDETIKFFKENQPIDDKSITKCSLFSNINGARRLLTDGLAGLQNNLELKI